MDIETTKQKCEIQQKRQNLIEGQSGFSMMETVVVLCIVTVLGVMSLSFMPLVDGMKFQNEAVKFRNALVFARNWAIAHSQCVKVEIEPGTQTIAINAYRLPASLNCSQASGVHKSISKVSFEKFVSFNGFEDANSLVFGHRGSTTRADVAKFTISHIASSAKAIYSVMPATGKVSSK